MHTVLTHVVPVIALAAVPFFFANPARARPINKNYEFNDDNTPAARYDSVRELSNLHEQKRDLAIPLVDRGLTIATSQAKRDEESEIVEHGDAPIFVTLEKRNDAQDGSATNVQLRPTKRWDNGPTCCGNPCWTPCWNGGSGGHGGWGW